MRILEVPKDSTRTPLEIIKNVIKLSGYKIILKQSLAFLFTIQETWFQILVCIFEKQIGLHFEYKYSLVTHIT